MSLPAAHSCSFVVLASFAVTTEILLLEHGIGRVGLLCARIFGYHCSDGELEEGCPWVKGSLIFTVRTELSK
jgi:hypothetical protein